VLEIERILANAEFEEKMNNKGVGEEENLTGS
jgi:hypothetical protein